MTLLSIMTFIVDYQLLPIIILAIIDTIYTYYFQDKTQYDVTGRVGMVSLAANGRCLKLMFSKQLCGDAEQHARLRVVITK